MESIEYRYTQGERLTAAVQLEANKKYWNEKQGRFQEELDDNCCLPMVELSYDNVYNDNIDRFDFMRLYKDRIEDGLYVTASPSLNIATGVLYSIYILKDGNLISKTTRRKESSKKLLEIINEVQVRLGFPISKRMSEPNARKIRAFVNDAITILLTCGRDTPFSETRYEYVMTEGEREIEIAPACSQALNGLGKLYVEGREILPSRSSISAIDSKGTPLSYAVVGKSAYSVRVAFNSEVKKDTIITAVVYEKPRKMEFSNDRSVFESDLIIKGAEMLAKDDAGMGGDISGRELFIRYITTDSNMNCVVNENRFYV